MTEANWSELYKLFREETHKSIELHSGHFKNFLTLLIAISAATLTGAQYYIGKYYQMGFILILGGVFGIVAAFFGKKICDKFYEGMLEAITVTAKLEEKMGLTLEAGNAQTFSQDTNLMPQRWLDNRKHYETSQAFITAHMNQGSNNMVRRTFNIMIIAFFGVLTGGAMAVLLGIIEK